MIRLLFSAFGFRVRRDDPLPELVVQKSPESAPAAAAVEPMPYVPLPEAEREAIAVHFEAERTARLAVAMHVNEFADTAEVCAARVADPSWREEQEAKRQAASDRFAEARAAAGMPLIQKLPGERF